jgi:predicted nucleic acid-binding protein
LSAFVLDNSVVMRWLFKDGSAADLDYADRVLGDIISGEGAISTPALWPYEVANVTATGLRKNKTTEPDREEFLALLATAPITIVATSFEVITNRVVDLAHRYRLSAYDASYLELALRLQVPLATLDKDLRKSLAAEGGTLFAADAVP